MTFQNFIILKKKKHLIKKSNQKIIKFLYIYTVLCCVLEQKKNAYIYIVQIQFTFTYINNKSCLEN